MTNKKIDVEQEFEYFRALENLLTFLQDGHREGGSPRTSKQITSPQGGTARHFLINMYINMYVNMLQTNQKPLNSHRF